MHEFVLKIYHKSDRLFVLYQQYRHSENYLFYALQIPDFPSTIFECQYDEQNNRHRLFHLKE